MTDSRIRNVLVAGPNGSLGQSVLKHLANNGFNITLLTRDVGKTKQAFPGYITVQANYESQEELEKTLRNDVGKQDTLVILINREQPEAQNRLLDAAIAVGIKHVIPSSFGIGTREPEFRRLPVWFSKVKMEDHIIQKAEEGAITFTGIQNGAFLDWALERGVYLNVKGGDTPFVVFDGGDIPFSASNVDDIAKAVAAVLGDPGKFRNRFVYMHSAVVTQNQLLALAKELVPDRKFNAIQLDTAEVEKQAWEKYNAGDRSNEVLRMFMPRVTFGERKGLFEHVDNDELGIQQLDDDGIKQVVARFV